MLEISIKYGVLIICSFYVFLKLLHIQPSKKVYFLFIALLFLFLPILYALRLYAVALSTFMMVFLFCTFCVNALKMNISLAITTATIAFGITYAAFFLAATIVGMILTFLDNLNTPYWISLIFIFTIQLLIITIPFKSRRLKNGMPFLIEHGASDVGVYLSFTLLVTVSFLSMNKDINIVKMISVFFVFFCGLIIVFWWRNSLTKKYLEKVKAQELWALQEAITHKESEISQLKHHNNELSKIIHKDNKMIPALEYAVRQYLLTAGAETDRAAHLAKGQQLLSQIENVSKERSGLIASYESGSRSLPSTGVPSVDTLLMYMYQKAKEQRIDFNLSLSGSVRYLVENIVTEQDINTLLADLIENAVIATKKCAQKNILVHIGITDNIYTIGIFDSGLPFTPETVNDIGLKRTTTHAGEGGSGIGLVTTFEILKKYQASFVIEDISDNVLYVKNVSVCFDKLGQFRIKTAQQNNAALYPEREDIVLMREIGA